MIDAVGYEAVGHAGTVGDGGNGNATTLKHDHSEV
jgi:hypothetical protein